MPHHTVHHGSRHEGVKTEKEIDGHMEAAHAGRNHAAMSPKEVDARHEPHAGSAPRGATPDSMKIAMGNDQMPYPSDIQPEPGGEGE